MTRGVLGKTIPSIAGGSAAASQSAQDVLITANMIGQIEGSEATFSDLGNITDTVDGDWALLTADDIGTGDVANPQYPSCLLYTSPSPRDS